MDRRADTEVVEAATARILSSFDTMIRCSTGWQMPGFLALDVTMSQAKVLRLLSVDGSTAMSNLATRLGISMPTLSGVADRLVEHGLVERQDDPGDRRHVLLSLTPAGEQVIERFREVGHANMRALLEDLSPDDLLVLDRGLSALARSAERLAAERSGAPATPQSQPPNAERTPR